MASWPYPGLKARGDKTRVNHPNDRGFATYNHNGPGSHWFKNLWNGTSFRRKAKKKLASEATTWGHLQCSLQVKKGKRNNLKRRRWLFHWQMNDQWERHGIRRFKPEWQPPGTMSTRIWYYDRDEITQEKNDSCNIFLVVLFSWFTVSYISEWLTIFCLTRIPPKWCPHVAAKWASKYVFLLAILN